MNPALVRDTSGVRAIVLAAGSATRFGSNKLVAPLHGRPLLTHALDAVRTAGLDCTLVIDATRPDRFAAALRGRSVSVVPNADAGEGIASSIRAGIRSLGPDTRAAVLVMGDQPLIQPAMLHRMVSQWSGSEATIVVTRCRGVLGPPVLFDRSVFAELLELKGDSGARAVVERVAGRTATVDADEHSLTDVDTIADLNALERGAPEGL